MENIPANIVSVIKTLLWDRFPLPGANGRYGQLQLHVWDDEPISRDGHKQLQ